jgi:hypothetical protein
MSQVNQIAEILRRNGRITNFWCIDTKLTLRLAARINDLRNKGWEIKTTEKANKDTEYVLIKDPTAPVKSMYQQDMFSPVL